MSTIGFIGLGNMGMGMAVNLAKAGHEVRAFDISKAAVATAVQGGCIAAADMTECASEADVILSMLPAGSHVRAVYCEAGGVLEHAKAEAVLIDSSTIDVSSAREVSAAASDAGFNMVDAPVSGGVAGANAGTLTFMCGGEREAFERAKPYLDIMGKNIFHAGDAGNGQVAKIANNMLLGIHMAATCEAFNLAQKLGLDAQTFYDIASTASGQNWSMTSYCPAPGPVPAAPSNHDYKAGFSAAMMLKDMRLAQAAARECGAAIAMGEQAQSLYTEMESKDQGDLDFSAVMKLITGSL